MVKNRPNLTICTFLIMVAILTELSVCNFLEELGSEKMEFQCYMDICTVGIHFCSIEDQACVPCTEDVCNEPDSPSMCKVFCKYKDGDVAKTTTPTSLLPNATEPLVDIQQADCLIPDKRIEIVIITGFLLSVGGLIVMLTYWIFKRCKQKRNIEKDTIVEKDHEDGPYKQPIPESNENLSYTETVTSHTQLKVV